MSKIYDYYMQWDKYALEHIQDEIMCTAFKVGDKVICNDAWNTNEPGIIREIQERSYTNKVYYVDLINKNNSKSKMFREYEIVLANDEEPELPPPIPKVQEPPKAVDPEKAHLYKRPIRAQDQCIHRFEIVGYNSRNEPWYNCQYCLIAKEDTE